MTRSGGWARSGEEAEARRFRRLEATFRALRDLPATERADRLRTLAAEDAGLAREVETMLAHDRPGDAAVTEAATEPGASTRTGRSVASPAVETDPLGVAESMLRRIAGGPVAERSAADPRRERRVGPYRLLRELGVGASGVVYLAEDERTGREVALKLLHGFFAGAAALARFRREAALLSRLEHPGLARILDADVVDGPTGRQAYIAMDPVHGMPVTRWVAMRGPGRRGVLELLAEIAEAVAHLHERGVVHRDLKPANVLVDAAGRPRVLDLGAARLSRPDGPEGAGGTGGTGGVFTETGQVIGTATYMAPEQFEGVPERIGPPADVYALGVLAYRLLAGRLPLDVSGLPLAEAARVARDEEPSSLGSVDRTLRGPVSAIVGTALEKDPSRRYPDAAALAADLRRLLQDEAVVARSPSLAEQVRRATRRNRRLVHVAVGVLVVLLSLLAIATTVAVTSERLRQQEAASRRDAEDREAEARRLRELAAAERDEAVRQAAAASLAAAESATRAGEIGEARRQLERVPPRYRGWIWDHLHGRTDRSEGPAVTSADGARLEALLPLPDGRIVVAPLAFEGPIRVLHSDGAIDRWPAEGWVNQVAAGPDPDTVILAGHRGVELLDLRTGARRSLLGPDVAVRSVVLAADDRTLVVGGTRGEVRWLDLPSGRTVARLAFGRPGDVHLVPIAAAAAEATKAAAEAAGIAGRGDGVRRGAIEDPGSAADASARLEGGSLLAVVHGLGGRLLSLEPGGRPRAVPLWTEAEPDTVWVAGGPRGDLAATMGFWGVVRVRRAPDWTVASSWPTPTGRPDPVLVLEDDSVVVAGPDAVSWHDVDGTLRRRLAGHEELARAAVHVGDGRLLTVAWDGTLRRWDLLAPESPVVLEHPRLVRRVAFSPDSRLLATGGGAHPTPDGRVRIWDAADGTLLARLEPGLVEVTDLLVVAGTGGAEASVGGADRPGASPADGPDPAPGPSGPPGGTWTAPGRVEARSGGDTVIAVGKGIAAWALDVEATRPAWTALADVGLWSAVDLRDGTVLVATFGGDLFRLDVRDGSIVGRGRADVRGAEAVRLPDGAVLLVGCAGAAPAPSAWLRLDPLTMRTLDRREVPRPVPRAVVALPGAWAVGEAPRTGAASSASAQPGPSPGTERSAAGSPLHAAVAHADGTVVVLDARTLEERAVVRDVGDPYALAVLPERSGWSLVVASSDRLLRFARPGDAVPTDSLLVHAQSIADVAVSPDAGTIATASRDRTAALWHRTIPNRRLRPDAAWPPVRRSSTPETWTPPRPLTAGGRDGPGAAGTLRAWVQRMLREPRTTAREIRRRALAGAVAGAVAGADDAAGAAPGTAAGGGPGTRAGGGPPPPLGSASAEPSGSSASSPADASSGS